MHASWQRCKKSASSSRWLARQVSDPYVRNRGQSGTASASHGLSITAAGGFRSRASFKLASIQEKYPQLLLPVATEAFGVKRNASKVIVDLGSAPGGWSQVAAQVAGSRGRVFALDINAMEAVEGVQFIQGDFLDPAMQLKLRLAVYDTKDEGRMSADSGTRSGAASLESSTPLPGSYGRGFVDTVLSDMMAPMSGVRDRDIQASLDLVTAATTFAKMTLRRASEHDELVTVRGRQVSPGGCFVAKYFAHPDLDEFRRSELDPAFAKVVIVKPRESRAESSEAYLVCLGYRGDAERRPPAFPG